MEINGLTADQFRDILATVSTSQYGGNLIVKDGPTPLNRAGTRFRVSLRAVTSRGAGARRSWSGRRSVAVCWHAFRDVYAELFRLFPDATVRTAMAVYRGKVNFEESYRATGDRNIGSLASPAYMPELCECEHGPAPAAPAAAPARADDTAGVLARMEAAIREAEESTPYTWMTDGYTFRGADMDSAPAVR